MIRSDYYIYCPHCGEEVTIKKHDLDPEIDQFDIKCHGCNKEIHVEVEYRPIFQVDKLTRGCCLECGEELAYVSKPLTEKDKVSKYMEVPDEQYCLCHKCETKLKFEDVTQGDFKFIMRKRKR